MVLGAYGGAPAAVICLGGLRSYRRRTSRISKGPGPKSGPAHGKEDAGRSPQEEERRMRVTIEGRDLLECTTEVIEHEIGRLSRL